MTVAIITGIQWGDEGKGKITDLLSGDFDCVARYQGGNNAGHTVVRAGETFKLHFIPSGILEPNHLAVMGHGMVIGLPALVEEINKLKKQGVAMNGLRISDRAFTILPVHIDEDRANEQQQGSIGTTVKGIGPAYKDKIGRTGIRVGDFFNHDIKKRLATRGLRPRQIGEQMAAFHALKRYVCDTIALLHELKNKKKNILLEGAQATLLDIDFGTYPYVTASSPSAAGACTGTGLPPTSISRVIGITKAYTTRVGKGPFPGELVDNIGDFIRERGHEYGTTTGRPRRCGWLDLVALNYTTKINGVTDIGIMKIDILTGLPEIKIVVAYRINGKIVTDFPSRMELLTNAKPVYRVFKGWKQDIRGIRRFSALPVEARRYLGFIERQLRIPLTYISTSPETGDTIIR